MHILVRTMAEADRSSWARMRSALWPEEAVEDHAREIDGLLSSGEAWGFSAEVGRAPAGFAELAIRKHANGCLSRPVLFLEGIWVEEEFRQHAVGSRLIAHAAAFAVAQGFTEIGSDADIDNLISHAAHRGWGFVETERVVYFRKSLIPDHRAVRPRAPN